MEDRDTSLFIKENDGLHLKKCDKLFRRSTSFYLFMVIVLGLFLRIGSYYFEPLLSRDSCSYIQHALFLQQHDYQTYQSFNQEYVFPPFFIKVLSQTGKGGDSIETVGRVFVFIFGMLCIPLVGFIAHAAWEDSRIAILSSMLVSVNPVLIALSCQIQRDIPAFFFGGCSFLLLLLSIGARNKAIMFYAGCCAGLACVFRYEYFFFSSVILFICLVQWIRLKQQHSLALKVTFFFIGEISIVYICYLFVDLEAYSNPVIILKEISHAMLVNARDVSI